MVTGIPGIELISSKRAASSQAFSLVEILLVISLLALLAGIVAGNLGVFIKGANFEPPERVLKKSVLDAVYFSSERKRSTYLSYLEENATFLVSDSMGQVLAEHKVYQKLGDQINRSDKEIPKVDFFTLGPLSGLDGDDTPYDDDELLVKRVLFHSGSSFPFQARIRFGGKENDMYFDPFSGYFLKSED